MPKRNYSNTAVPQVLGTAVTATATTLSVGSVAGFPAVPFLLGLERGTANEEVVYCTAKDTAANTFTVQRGYDGTTAKSHAVGALVEHTVAAIDYRESGIVRLTTAERDALAGDDRWTGRMIYNTTVNKFQAWDGTAWNESIGGIPGEGVTALYRQATAPASPAAGTVWINSGEVIAVPGPTLAGYRERWSVLGNVSGTVTLNFAAHNTWTINPTANVTIAFSNLPTASDESARGTLVVQNSTYTITWPAGTRFPGGTAPALNGKTYLSIVVEPGGQIVVGTAWSNIA